jgi:hypothetical protein
LNLVPALEAVPERFVALQEKLDVYKYSRGAALRELRTTREAMRKPKKSAAKVMATITPALHEGVKTRGKGPGISLTKVRRGL